MIGPGSVQHLAKVLRQRSEFQFAIRVAAFVGGGEARGQAGGELLIDGLGE